MKWKWSDIHQDGQSPSLIHLSVNLVVLASVWAVPWGDASIQEQRAYTFMSEFLRSLA